MHLRIFVFRYYLLKETDMLPLVTAAFNMVNFLYEKSSDYFWFPVG